MSSLSFLFLWLSRSRRIMTNKEESTSCRILRLHYPTILQPIKVKFLIQLGLTDSPNTDTPTFKIRADPTKNHASKGELLTSSKMQRESAERKSATMERQSTEKRQLLRSCEGCRAAKIRCVPDDQSDDQCQRCHRLKRPCVFSEARNRVKRGTLSQQSRVADLEKKIDHLSSLLEKPDHGRMPCETLPRD